jgi:hypothetical protein
VRGEREGFNHISQICLQEEWTRLHVIADIAVRLHACVTGKRFLTYFIILSNAYMQIERLIEIIGAWAFIYEPDCSAVLLVKSRRAS